jgi:phosphatidylinositol alpha-1,6-mannosyltransferase
LGAAAKLSLLRTKRLLKTQIGRRFYAVKAGAALPHSKIPQPTRNQFLPSPSRVCQTHRVLIGLFPELNAPGGIQRAGRHLAFVMSEYAASHKMESRFLSLNDTQELHRMHVGDREFVFTGAHRGKLRFAANAIRAARRRPKLVLAAHPNLAPLLRYMRLLAPSMKSIVCTHGIEVWEPLPATRRNALCRATIVLSPSRATADHLINVQDVSHDRIRVLPWALDPDFATKFTGAPSSPLPADFPPGRVILSVGRWLASERYKGMDTLILAMSRLLLRWPDLQLAIVGSGDDRGWLEHVARDSGVQRHVHFLTDISYGELSSCYEAAEIFALPSRGEGFGFVYLEAMAHGKPVIGGAHGGAPEVIQDGVTGYVVQHGDTVQLATSIDTLLSNPENARQMGEAGRQRVENEYRFNIFSKGFKKILRELCES